MIAEDKNLDNLLINFLLACLIAITFGVIDVHFARAEKEKQEETKQQEERVVVDVSEEKKPLLELTTEPQKIEIKSAVAEKPKAEKPTKAEIEDYIRQKFGEDADKAFLLLKGRGEGTCAENRNLDPYAVNDNTKWGGKGKDWGLFQINDRFHPVFKLNLHKDWRANVDYAFKLYVESGYTFAKFWTAGKCLKSQGYDI